MDVKHVDSEALILRWERAVDEYARLDAMVYRKPSDEANRERHRALKEQIATDRAEIMRRLCRQ